MNKQSGVLLLLPTAQSTLDAALSSRFASPGDASLEVGGRVLIVLLTFLSDLLLWVLPLEIASTWSC